MKTLSFVTVLLASTALVACGGGGGEDPADTSDAANGSGSEAVMASADGSEDGGATVEEQVEDAADDAADAADELMGEAADAADDMMDEATNAAEDAANAAEDAVDEAVEDATGGGDEGGAFMVAGLTGDPAAGARVFARCRSCHVLDEGVNRNGPSLYGIVGREAGTVEGFRYSDANANSGIVWTEEVLFEYLENPREYVPGTFMAFPGLRDAQDRADIIAYIKENGGDA